MTVTDRAGLWRAGTEGLPYEPYLLSGNQVGQSREVFRRRGAVVLGPAALHPTIFEGLVQESKDQRRHHAWELSGDGSAGVSQDTVRAHLGPLARELCAAGSTRALIQAVTGHQVMPGWSASCLTYYDQPGQFLGAHRDKVDACFFAFLVYLEVEWPPDREPGPGLSLHICGPREDDVVQLTVLSRPNRIVLMQGSALTHFRPALFEGERVGLLAGCFESLES